MSNKQIYEKAYQLIGEHQELYSCNAIQRASIALGQGIAQSQQKSYAYGVLFKPDSYTIGYRNILCSWLMGYALDEDNPDPDLGEKDLYNWRLTALAFCIAMAETGDL